MKRDEQLQPPIVRELEVKFHRVGEADPHRLRRVTEILLDILDNKPLEPGGAPEEGNGP